MTKCPNCNGRELSEGPQSVALEVGPRSFEGEAPGWSCASCAESYIHGPDLGHFEQLVAEWLAQHGFESGKELRFIRKVIGLRASDLAELLGVTSETVSHWETGKHQADVETRTALSGLLLDKIAGTTATRDLLEAHRKPDQLRKVRLPLRATA